MDGFDRLVQALLDAAIQGEIWVNGSFLTEKVDAKDVDLILRVQGEFYDSAASDEHLHRDGLGRQQLEGRTSVRQLPAF